MGGRRPDAYEKTASGRLQRRLSTNLNQYERENTGDRVRNKIEELARIGKRAGGWTPPGYVLVKPHEYELHPKYAPMVRRIFEDASAGKTIGDITEALRIKGFVVRVRQIERIDGPDTIGGRPFTWDQVKGIINNPFYKGVLLVGKPNKKPRKEFQAIHPPIVSPELWKSANAAIKRHEHPVYVPRENKHQLILHGLAFCGCCSFPMVSHPGTSWNGRSYLYYRCQKLRKYGSASKCNIGQIRADELERAVIAKISFLAKDPTVLNAAMEDALKCRKQAISPLKERISSLDQEIERKKSFCKDLRDKLLNLPKGSEFISEIAAEGDRAVIERKALEVQKKVLLAEKAVLEQRLGAGSQMRADLRHFTEIFGALPNDKKQQALQLVISRITVNRPTGKVTKSRVENSEPVPLRHKNAFSVDLDLYVKSSSSKSLRDQYEDCVSDPEMAARAGIEPATK